MVDAEQDFRDLEPRWTDLLLRSGGKSLTSTFEFVHTWWEHLPGRGSLHILVAAEEGRIVGVAPLVISTVKRAGVGARKASFVLPRYLEADFIAEKGREVECAEVFLKQLKDERSCQYLELSGLTDESGTKLFLEHSAPKLGFSYSCRLHSAGRYVPVVGSWEDFLEGRGWKLRKNLRHDLNILRRTGRLEVVRIREGSEAYKMIEKAETVDAKSWKAGLTTAPKKKSTRNNLLRRLAALGWIDFFALELDGTPIAYWLFVRYGRKGYAFYTAYDGKYASRSPGSVLLYLALGHIFREREVDEVDFLTDYTYLRKWTEFRRNRFVATLYPQNIGGRVTHAARAVLHSSLGIHRATYLPGGPAGPDRTSGV